MTMAYSRILAVIYSCCVVLQLVGYVFAKPVLYGLPADRYIGDLEDSVRIIDFLNVTDTVGSSFTCAISSIVSAPANDGDEFEIKWDPLTGYEVWTTAAGIADFDNPTIDTYTLNIECTNNAGAVSTGVNDYITVHVEANEKVSFGSLPTSIAKDASTTSSGATVFTESISTAVGGHASNIQCSMKSASVDGYFNVAVASTTGTCEVLATANLIGIDASKPTVQIVMEVTDSVEKITVYEKLTVVLSNQNTIPLAANLPESPIPTIQEDTAVGTTLFTVSVTDPDNGQVHTFSRSCLPATGNNLITIDSNGRIKLNDSLDYETTTQYVCSIHINDQIHTGGPFTYTLNVGDANETPTFDQTTYYATFTEGAAGSSTIDPGMTCTDLDNANTKSYSFLSSTYSPYFSIDTSGKVTFAQAYDVDTNGLPTSVSLTVLCTDSNTIDGTTKTGSATLVVTINDDNDNTPTFSPSSYTLYVDQFDKPGDTVGTYKPTDGDLTSPNNAYTCTSTSTSSYGTYYNIGSNCEITIASTIDFDYGTTVKYDVSAVDQGTPANTGVGKLDIIYKEASTTTVSTTTTTTESYNFWDHPENIAMFVLLLLAALALIGLLTWCLARLCCGATGGNFCDCCNPRSRPRRYPPRRAVTPEYERTPPRPRKSYSPPPREKVTVIRERPPVPSIYQAPPPYYNTPGRYPPPGTVIPGGTFPRSPFVPYR